MDERVMVRFQELLKKDPAIQAFAAGQDLLLSFSLTDTGKGFYFGFKGGNVQADAGEPEDEPQVVLHMKSDVLDGIMSGKTNPFTAAMSGKIHITGDLMKAAALQKTIKDMVRIYTQAKSEVESE